MIRLRAATNTSQPLSRHVAPAETAPHTATDLPTLLKVCERQVHTRLRAEKLTTTLILLSCALLLAATAIGVFGLQHHQLASDQIMPFASLSVIIARIVTGVGQKQMLGARVHVKAACALTAFANDPRILVPLLEALPCAAGDARRTLLETVMPRLWNLTADNSLDLPPSARAVLRRELSRCLIRVYGIGKCSPRFVWNQIPDDRADFALAAMKALALLGDARSDALLRQFALIPPDPNQPNTAVLHEAARELVPLLQARQTENAGMKSRLLEIFPQIKQHQINDATLVALSAHTTTAGLEKSKAALVELCEQEQKRDHKRRTAQVAFSLISALLYATLSWQDKKVDVFKMFLLILNVSFSGGVGSLFVPDKGTYRDAVSQLIRLKGNDKRLLNTYLDYARGHPQNAELIALPVIELLNDIQPGDGVYLSYQNQSYLRGWLRKATSEEGERKWADVRRIRAVAHALSALGDKRALPLLRRLAYLHPDKDIRVMAHECTLTLRERLHTTAKGAETVQ